MSLIDTDTAHERQVVSGLLSSPIASMQRVYGGRNNRVYRVICGPTERYAAKFYPQDAEDDRDRLYTEYTSLKFLSDNGVACVARPVGVDRSQGCALFEYVDGREIPSSEVTPSDIDAATDFLVALKQLSRSPCSDYLPTAAEAFLTVQQTFTSIEGRLNRLLGLPLDGPQYLDLHDFLRNAFSSVLAEIRQWCESTLGRWGASLTVEIRPEERTLSPSDFGFHNALRRPNGQIVFLDFEYFGWDDPAKMISDFLLHPAMELDHGLKQRFVTNMLAGLGENGDLAKRLRIAYPLFGLKWCLIVLNEFLPEKLSIRERAAEALPSKSDLQSQQLAKAKWILQRANLEYQNFPYRI